MLDEKELEGEDPEPTLDETLVTVPLGEDETTHEAVLGVGWEPWPMVYLETTMEPARNLGDRFWAELPDLSLKCRLFPVDQTHHMPAEGGSSTDLMAFVEDSTLYPKRQRRFVQMTAYLPNFHLPFVQDSAPFSFWMHGWNVDIEPLVIEDEERREVRDSVAGTFFTHRIEIERTGRRWFREETGRAMLKIVGELLTFTKGQSCRPLLAYGKTTTGRQFWLNLQVKSPSRQSGGSWVPDFGEIPREQAWIPALKNLAPGFGILYREFPEIISRMVYWYRLSNTEPNVESALIRSQVGLETLTSVWNERGWFHGGEDNTHEKIETMLDRAHVNQDLPEFIEETTPCQRWLETHDQHGNPIGSGPVAVTTARNAIVHLDQTKLRMNRTLLSNPNALKLIQMLATSYMEKLILFLSEYEGEIRDPFGGEPEPAPWTPNVQLEPPDV